MTMKKGVLAVVAASFLYGIMPIFTKRVLMEGMTSGSVVFYRLFFSAVFSFIFPPTHSICVFGKSNAIYPL